MAPSTRTGSASATATSTPAGWSSGSASRTGNGVVRVSMVHYNTLDEVDRLIAALDEALRQPA